MLLLCPQIVAVRWLLLLLVLAALLPLFAPVGGRLLLLLLLSLGCLQAVVPTGWHPTAAVHV
jgi:hypothetical protein